MTDPKAIYKDPLGRQYDPLPVYRKLVIESKGRINDLLADWEAEDPLTSAVAEEELVRVARAAFALVPFSQPNGHTDSQALDVLANYLEFAAKKGKGPKSQPTSQQSMGSAPLTVPTTKKCSGCG